MPTKVRSRVTDQQIQQFVNQIRPPDFYLQLISMIPDVNLFVKDANSHWMMCDDGFVAMLGCSSKEEVLGKTATAIKVT